MRCLNQPKHFKKQRVDTIVRGLNQPKHLEKQRVDTTVRGLNQLGNPKYFEGRPKSVTGWQNFKNFGGGHVGYQKITTESNTSQRRIFFRSYTKTGLSKLSENQ